MEDRSSLLKGYNAMYVKDVEDENTHTFLLISSLIINGFSIQKSFSLMFLFHVEGVEGAKIHSIECMYEILYKRSKQCQRCQRCLLHALCKIFQ